MTSDRFKELVNGPLNHPFVMVRVSRLCMALAYVVHHAGPAAVEALEEHCRGMNALDRFKGGEDDDRALEY